MCKRRVKKRALQNKQVPKHATKFQENFCSQFCLLNDQSTNGNVERTVVQQMTRAYLKLLK